MTCKMTFTSATKDVFDILDWTLQPLFECYSARIVDEHQHPAIHPYRLNIVSPSEKYEPRHDGAGQEAPVTILSWK